MEISLYETIQKNDTITGLYHFKNSDDAMDLEFIDKKIVNCIFFKGDFCSSSFRNCTFDNVEFVKCALVGVGFQNCIFKKCKITQTQCSFSMTNCTIENLSNES